MDGERAEASLRLLAEAELPTEAALRVSPPDHAAAWLLRQPAVAAATLLSALPELEGTAVRLQYQAGLSEAETAAAMRISVEGVRYFTQHGRMLLRSGMSGYDRMQARADADGRGRA
jgi:DNA-directed RNA polymerase specialized sigma24 family protein